MARSTVVRHETAVGSFMLIACALLAGALVMKGAHVGLGAREVVFQDDAGHDLKRGAAVKMKGIEVGEVSNVSLKPDNNVEIRLKIYPEYRENVHQDAIAKIVEPPLLGSASVELIPGTAGELKQGQQLKREEQEGLLTRIESSAKDLNKVVDRVNVLADKAQTSLESIGTIAKKIEEGKGVIGRLVNDEKLAEDFTKGVRGTVQIVDDVANARGAWSILRDETVSPNIRTTIADVRSMTDAIANGQGAIGRLMTKENVVLEAEATLHDLRGALAKLDEISRDAHTTTQKVQQILDSGKGAIDRLDGTIKNAEKATNELAGVAEKINKGQGTLAKLVNDDALFREARSLLKELRESVEDLREQAPINAFIGVVFSAF